MPPPRIDAKSPSPAELLRRGQIHESQSNLPAALADYDQASAQLHALSSSDPLSAAPEIRRQLALAWMNCGNVLQKLPVTFRLSSLRDQPTCHLINDIPSEAPGRASVIQAAVQAYDQAIALFETLPVATEPAFRNHLGAAWLNRGHALIVSEDSTAALTSFEHAIDHLQQLPLSENPFFRLNLVGAWTNHAHLQIASAPELARTSARHALSLLDDVEAQTPAFAEMSLRARRALVTALGQLLVAAEHHGSRETSIPALATEASDAIDDGLALARTWEINGVGALRPLALRLFRLGAQLYRIHQPHFLAEFLLENLRDPAPFAHRPEFHEVADHALQTALAALQQPRHFIVGSPESEQLLTTVQSLRAARAQLSVSSFVTSVPPLVSSV